VAAPPSTWTSAASAAGDVECLGSKTAEELAAAARARDERAGRVFDFTQDGSDDE